MNFESGKLFHVGINFLVAPVKDITRNKVPAFQQSLINVGIDVDATKFERQGIVAVRQNLPLKIQVGTIGPQVAQVLVVAPNPQRDSRVVIQESNAVIEAFINTWETQNLQVVACDATVRHLYDSDRDHAFQELWEDRLQQVGEFQTVFGKPVAGGGLRFVMPPLDTEDDPKEIEVKIESFLQDPKQFFIDVQYKWAKPSMSLDVSSFRVEDRINSIEDFIENNVRAFMERD